MQKRILYSCITLALTIIVVVISRIPDNLPWWIFTVPVLLCGLLIRRMGWKVPCFFIGFLSGLLIWSGSLLYFTLTGSRIVLTKTGQLLSVPGVLVLLAAGLTGGLLTGLALYTGNNIPIIKAQTNI